MSKKSIVIKKSSKVATKIDILKTQKVINKCGNKTVTQSLTKLPNQRLALTRIPIKLTNNEETKHQYSCLLIKKDHKLEGSINNKENSKQNSQISAYKRRSKTADEMFIKKLNPAKVTFLSPPATHQKSHPNSIIKTPFQKDINAKQESRQSLSKF